MTTDGGTSKGNRRLRQLLPQVPHSVSLLEKFLSRLPGYQSQALLSQTSGGDEWQTKILPALKKAQLAHLAKLSGLSRSTLIEIRAGHSRPHRKNQELLAQTPPKIWMS